MKKTSNIISNFNQSIFIKMTDLALKENAINLSQGLPDFDCAPHLYQYLNEACTSGKNQSSPAKGLLKLRDVISANYENYYNLKYNSQTEITITNGATEALFSTIQAITNPGDEIIVFEPFFDTYIPAIKMAHATPIIVTLHGPKFNFDIAELKKAFSIKTKAVIFNSPHNPTGKVFTKKEIELLSNLVIEHDCYLISDEVYEYLLYDNATHIPPAVIDGMKERTITISSSGKTMGMTGWRVGWACAPARLSSQIDLVHQNVTFSAPRPQQEALVKCLSKLDNYLPDFREIFQNKRDILFDILSKSELTPLLPSSTYFILAKIPDNFYEGDIAYCRQLIIEKKLATIPCSAFYENSLDGSRYLRFCFAKKNETLLKLSI